MEKISSFFGEHTKNMPQNENNGFTLVELLIVIVIIGIISAILAVGVKSQVDRARDARAKSNMSQLQIEATKIRNDYGAYDPNIFCCSGSSCKQEVVINCGEIRNQVKMDPVIHSAGDKFCAYIKLNTGTYFCLDSSGVINEFDSVACATDTYSCSL